MSCIAAKPTTRIDTIFNFYSPLIHDKLIKRVTVMPDSHIKHAYVEIFQTFAKLKLSYGGSYHLHSSISSIIVNTIQKLYSNTKEAHDIVQSEQFLTQYDLFIRRLYMMYAESI
jgi:hypothetical protein